MKILVVHNFYGQAGGEDAVVRDEVELLRERGHIVDLFAVSNSSITGLWRKVRAAIETPFSLSSYRRLKKLLESSAKPDIVHVHNTFPLLSPSVFYACARTGVPVVHTLHNYRLVCPTATLLWDGAVTERSIAEGPWWTLLKKTYRGSLPGTFAICVSIWLHLRLGTWDRKVGRLIALTQFGKSKFVEAGISAEKLVVKPNFVQANKVDVPAEKAGFLFVGRLSEEKGIMTAVRACDAAGASLIVAGAGELELHTRAYKCATHLGFVGQEEIRAAMDSAIALLVPSRCYEGFPRVVVEAFSRGLPVIASDLGALSEIVEQGVTGILVPSGDHEAWRRTLTWACENLDEMKAMGLRARGVFEQKYSAEKNYRSLMEIYLQARNDATLVQSDGELA